MDDLKELVRIVSKNKAKNIEIIGQGANGRDSKVTALYEAMSSGRIEREEEAIEVLFSDAENPREAFQKARRKLKKRLMNTLMFIDVNQPGFADLQKAYYNCYREFAALKVLRGRRATANLVVPLAEKLLKRALQYEFTDLSVNVLRELRSISLVTEGHRDKMRRYHRLLRRQIDTLQAELMAEEYYQILAVHYVKSKASKSELENDAVKYLEELSAIPEDNRTQWFLFHYYQVAVFRYQISNDYPGILRVCEEALRVFGRRKLLITPSNHSFFRRTALTSQMHLGQYAAAEAQLKEILKVEVPGYFNWFVSKEYEMLLRLHQEDYQRGFEVFYEPFFHPEFEKLPPVYQERWQLLSAFMHYLVSIGKVVPTLHQEAHLRRFRLTRFLNEVREFSKDKLGANVTVLSLQILFLLQMNRYDDVVERMEALKAYANRHLRRNATFRSNCFIHLLLQIPQGYFHKKAVMRGGKKYLAKLAEMPISKSRQSSDLELIPYEQLWTFAFNSLRG